MRTLGLLVSLIILLHPSAIGAQTRTRPLPTARSAEEFNDAQAMGKITDAKEQITVAQKFLEKYQDSLIRPIAFRYIVVANVQLKEYARAMEMAERAINEQPDNFSVITEICRMASDLAHMKDLTHAPRARELGNKALESLNNGTIPYEFNEETWRMRRDMYVGNLRKSLGIIAYFLEQWSEASEHFTAATNFFPTDPYSYYLLAKCQYNVAAKTKEPAADKIEAMMSNLAIAFVLSEASAYAWLHSPVEAEMKVAGQNFKVQKSAEIYIQDARSKLTQNASPKP